MTTFHISIPVTDLPSARRFYGEILGCAEGRSNDFRVDYDFFGNHLVAHVEPTEASRPIGAVLSSGVSTIVRHFGVILEPEDWEVLRERVIAAGATFLSGPKRLFEGELREQSIMMLADNCGNAVEFKGQKHERIFAMQDIG